MAFKPKRMGINLSGLDFKDEKHSDVGSSPFTLNHDWFDSTSIQIYTERYNGGTQLVLNTDYTFGDLNSDLTSKVGNDVYGNITITNTTYQSGDLYISGKYIADTIKADDFNQVFNLVNILDENSAKDDEVTDFDVIPLDGDCESFLGDKPFKKDVRVENIYFGDYKKITSKWDRKTTGFFEKRNNLLADTSFNPRWWKRSDLIEAKVEKYGGKYFYRFRSNTNYGKMYYTLGEISQTDKYGISVLLRGNENNTGFIDLFDTFSSTNVFHIEINFLSKTVTTTGIGDIQYTWYGNYLELEAVQQNPYNQANNCELHIGVNEPSSYIRISDLMFYKLESGESYPSAPYFTSEMTKNHELRYFKNLTNDGTIEFWTILPYGNANKDRTLFSFYKRSNIGNNWDNDNIFKVVASSDKFKLDVITSASQEYYSNSNFTLLPYGWTHIKVTWTNLNSGTNNAEIKLFINGVFDTSISAQQIDISADTLSIGCDGYVDVASDSDGLLNGWLTDFAIKDYVDESNSHYSLDRPYNWKAVGKEQTFTLSDKTLILDKVIANEIEIDKLKIKDVDSDAELFDNEISELFELNTPDAVSNKGRLPINAEVVHEQPLLGKLQNTNVYHKDKGVLGLFNAITNFVATTDLNDGTKWNIHPNYHQDYGNIWDEEIGKIVWRWKRGYPDKNTSDTYIYDDNNTIDGAGTYTFSFWFKAEEDCYIRPGYFYGSGEEGAYRSVTANTWTKVEETITASSNPTGIQMCRILGKKRVRYVRDWVAGNTVNPANHWVELQVLDENDNNFAAGITPTVQPGDTISNASYVTDGDTTSANYATVSPADGNSHYVQIDLGSVKDIAAIKVWHYYNDGRTYHNTKTEISEDGTNWITIFDSDEEGEYVESSLGHRLNLLDKDKYLYATEPQIEKLEYATPFADLTRNSGSLYYYFEWLQQGTIEGWVKPRFNYDVTQNKYIISNHYDTSWQIAFYYNATNDVFQFGITDGTTTIYLNSTQITSNTALQQWTYFKIYWDTINSNYGMIIKNNDLDDNKTSTTALNTITFNDYLEIGSIPLYTSPSGYQFDGYITDVVFRPYVDTSLDHYYKKVPYYASNRILGKNCSWRIDEFGNAFFNEVKTIV